MTDFIVDPSVMVALLERVIAWERLAAQFDVDGDRMMSAPTALEFGIVLKARDAAQMESRRRRLSSVAAAAG